MYLAEVVEDALEEDGGGDDDGADGGHGPRRRLVQRPRPSFPAAHLSLSLSLSLAATLAAAVLAGGVNGCT